MKIRGEVSSQYLSALLIALPLAGGGSIEVEGELISKPYVTITLNMMRKFGIEVGVNGWRSFDVPGYSYVAPEEIHVEGDASSASYFLAAGAIAGGPVRVDRRRARQHPGRHPLRRGAAEDGRARSSSAPDWIEVSSAGKLQPVDMDLNHIPDAAMTAAVTALFADGQSVIRNIGSWQVKETDRLTAMAAELRKLGATVVEGPDFLKIDPPARLTAGRRHRYLRRSPHRDVLFAGRAGRGAGHDQRPGCVAKTFPAFFQALADISRG